MASPSPTIVPAQPAAGQPVVGEPTEPEVSGAIPRIRNALSGIADAGRERLTLAIILLAVLVVVGSIFAYLTLRRR